jgi:hypothetical protein
MERRQKRPKAAIHSGMAKFPGKKSFLTQNPKFYQLAEKNSGKPDLACFFISLNLDALQK